MSDILIKGMEMPKSCNACMFDVYGLCLINKNIEGKDELTHSCPLVPVPPHGDLIDRDALMDSDGDVWDGIWGYSGVKIMNALTIIPADTAEGGEV